MIDRVEAHLGGAVSRSGSAASGELQQARDEFPSLAFAVGAAPPASRLVMTLAEWTSDGLDFLAFDEAVDAAVGSGETTLALAGPRAWSGAAAIQVLTRCQRWIDRRNRAAAGPLF